MSANLGSPYGSNNSDSSLYYPEEPEEPPTPEWVVYLQHAHAVEVKFEDIPLLKRLISVIQPKIEKGQYFNALKELEKDKYKPLLVASESIRQLREWLSEHESTNLTEENVANLEEVNIPKLASKMPVGNTQFEPGNLPTKKGGARRRTRRSRRRSTRRRR